MTNDEDSTMAEIQRRLAEMAPEEQVDAMLHYFESFIEEMDTPSLEVFNAHCARRSEGTKIEEAMLEILEGKLVLRRMTEG